MITIRNYSLEFVPDDNFKKHIVPVSPLSGLLRDRDAVLVLALILLLYSDGCDRVLLFALIYIIT